MDNVELEVIDINDKRYMLIDSIEIYSYFVNIKDSGDLLILKLFNNQLVSVDTDNERDCALLMFYNKYSNNGYI